MENQTLRDSLQEHEISLEMRQDRSYTIKSIPRCSSTSTVDSRYVNRPLRCPGSRRPVEVSIAFRYSHGNYQSLLLLLALILLTRPFLPAASRDGQITCECSTTDCRNRGVHTCTTHAQCYSQLLENSDGSPPITRGCIPNSGTGIMCMVPPMVGRGPRPVLKCCQENLCNKDVSPIPLSIQYTQDEESAETDSLQRLGMSSIEEFRQKYDSEVPQGESLDQQSIYLMVIIGALVIMIGVTAVGSCLLFNYSRPKYIRAPQDPTEVKKRKMRNMLPAIITNHTTTKNLQQIYV